MPCGNIGDDAADLGEKDDEFEPEWWKTIGQPHVDTNPNGFMAKVSDKLGNGIDYVAGLIGAALFVFGGLGIRVVMAVANVVDPVDHECPCC